MINQSLNLENFTHQLDVYHNKKYLGSIPLEKPDREIMGYYGRSKIILNKPIQVKKHFFRKGSVVETECIPICGRIMINNKLDEDQIISESFAGFRL